MKTAVRYYSRSGNTKAFAEAIAKGAGVEAVSVDSADAKLLEHVDTLFIGGAVYAYGIDKHLKDFIQKIDSQNVDKAVVFSTSWISKHALDLIKNALADKGIAVETETMYAKSKQVVQMLPQAEEFGKKYA